MNADEPPYTHVVLVCGGRDYSDKWTAFNILDQIHFKNEITCIVHGHCSGADALADQWAKQHRVEVRRCPADWEKHGRAAGPIRNKHMLQRHEPHLVVAFPGGRGTQNMMNQAREAGVEVFDFSKVDR